MPLISQYGSNTNTERLNGPDRLNGAAQYVGTAQTVGEYEVAFNKRRKDERDPAGDLIEAPGTGAHAWGVLYKIPEAELKKLSNDIEGPSYTEMPIRVQDQNGNEVTESVTTFVVKAEKRRPNLWTSAKYVRHIVEGLRSHGVPEDYVQTVIDAAIQTNQNADDQDAAQREIPKIESLRDLNPSR